jgi:hypothetical protein
MRRIGSDGRMAGHRAGREGLIWLLAVLHGLVIATGPCLHGLAVCDTRPAAASGISREGPRLDVEPHHVNPSHDEGSCPICSGLSQRPILTVAWPIPPAPAGVDAAPILQKPVDALERHVKSAPRAPPVV